MNANQNPHVKPLEKISFAFPLSSDIMGPSMHKTTIFLSVVLLLAMIAMGAYVWQNEQDKKALLEQFSATPPPTPIEIPSTLTPDLEEPITTSTETPTSAGTITGSISFPSETIPDMEVCAENQTTKQEICTSDMLKETEYTFGFGYKLEVPAGTYHVYAKLPNDSYKAYYNDFVDCGLKAECTSHNPIKVNVSEGSTVTGVDPQDWYNRSN